MDVTRLYKYFPVVISKKTRKLFKQNLKGERQYPEPVAIGIGNNILHFLIMAGPTIF